jgi:hypothetical protein
VVAAAVLGALAGCSSGAGPHGAPSPSTGPPTAPSSAPSTVSVGERDAGRTLRVDVGAIVRVTLHSTYWLFEPVSDPAVLDRTGPVARATAAGVPGSGAGTVIGTWRATRRGTAVVTAHRTSCGEALRCVGAAGQFRLVVVVR